MPHISSGNMEKVFAFNVIPQAGLKLLWFGTRIVDYWLFIFPEDNHSKKFQLDIGIWFSDKIFVYTTD